MIDKLQELWNKFLYKLMFKNYRECDRDIAKPKVHKQKSKAEIAKAKKSRKAYEEKKLSK
jgi:hypothetical protein